MIGSTGAGKTTLVNLVPRLFDATSGTVRVGGRDVRDLDPDLLWAQLGLVPQKAYLFSGTVRSNLQYGKPDATDDEMWAALEVAQGRDFVEELPEGLDAPVAQGGTNFSGGQRQRLAIARALVRKPGIYLFDDSFSALDLATDARLRAALAPVTRDATVVIVAQRVSTIRDADLILVLEDGAVVGRGTHHELLADCATYQEIVGRSQLSRGGGSLRRRRRKGQEFKATERIEAPQAGPGRGPMGGGMVGQKAMDFGPSAKRLVARMRPDRGKAVLVVLLGVASVGLMSIGPRILGHATDLVFNGFIGTKIPPGTPESQWPEAVQGTDVVPGQGVDFDAVGDVLLIVLAIYAGASLLAWLQGFILNTRRAEHRAPAARGRRGEDQPAAARLLRPVAARRAALRGSPTTSTTSADPPADDEPAAHVGDDRGRGARR